MVFGWFEKKPELKVGDTVWDYWVTRISGSPPKKAIITQILPREGVFAPQKYFVREQDTGFGSAYPRSRKEIELIESAPEKPKRNMTQELQRSSWFDVIAKDNMRYTNGTRSGILEVKEGDLVRMRAVSDGSYELDLEGEVVRLSKPDGYETYIKKEEKDMGGELFGYPPEDDVPSTKHSVVAEREYEARIAELERQLEVSRRQKVAEEYGIVTERHLWSVVVGKPTKLVGFKIRHGGEHKCEVLTEGRNMVEAAMAAEAMAKGIDEDANVLSIDYVRVIGAVR